MTTTFLLIRHGTTDMVDRGISGRAPGVALNERGEREVRWLAEHLKGRKIDAMYMSPLERTRRTAEVLAATLGLTPIVNEALLELHFGEWTLQSFEALEPDPQWRAFNSFRCGTRIPGGELMLETQARAVSSILELRDKHPDQTIALVTHGDVIKTTLTYFLGMPIDYHSRFGISPASCSELELSREHVHVKNINLAGEIA